MTFIFFIIFTLNHSVGYSEKMIIIVDDYFGYQGSEVDVLIIVQEAENIGSMDITIEYNSTIVSLVDVAKGNLTVKSIVEYSTKGSLVKIIINDLEGFSGSGSVATVSFKLIGEEGAITELELIEVEANDAKTFVDKLFNIMSGSLEVKSPKKASEISCLASPSIVKVEEKVLVTGSIDPPKDGVEVTLTFKDPVGSTSSKTFKSENDGTFAFEFASSIEGSWIVTASWEGDQTHIGTESQVVSFTVEKKAGGNGIPGFPYESIIIGFIVGAIMLCQLRARTC